MTDSHQNIESLLSRIEQLEERQNITAKYAVNVKRDLDALTDKFNKLEQYFKQQATLRNDLATAKFNGLVSSEITGVECVTGSAENIMLDDSTDVTLVTPVEVEGNADLDEISTVVKQERTVTFFTDEEFKIARITQILNAYGDWLLLKAYLAEEKSQNTPLSTKEFWKQYNSGKRDFTGVNLAGANLSGVNLRHAKLSGANLKGADLSDAELESANLSKANLNDAYLHQAKLTSANLEKATLRRANLRGTCLNKAYLREADLSQASLRGALCGEVDFSYANLSRADLNKAHILHQYKCSGCQVVALDERKGRETKR